MQPILSVQNLSVEFRTSGEPIKAVNEVSFDLQPGETLAVVGESGSGKSVSMLSMLGLIPTPPAKVTSGSVQFDGIDLLKTTKEQLRSVRGRKIAMVFQDPMTSLNPIMKVGEQIGEILRLHLKLSKGEALRRSIELLELVGIPNASRRINEYPAQFSGGMRQRVMIAMALSCDPRLLIADEPTTALDVTIQMQIINIVRGLKDSKNMSIIWISHDLGVVAGIADRVIVMYAGHIVEAAPASKLFADPRHPYTAGLLASVPRIDKPKLSHLRAIEGSPPDLSKLDGGCPFYARCGARTDLCKAVKPTLDPVGDNHSARCHYANSGAVETAGFSQKQRELA